MPSDADVMIPMFAPEVPGESISAVEECLRSGWIGQGQAVAAFQDGFSRQFALPLALAVSSGTAALHLALLGAGVAAGDEVITTAQTFIATSMAVLYTGAAPVFADLADSQANLAPQDVERRITDKTKAILCVHYGGYPCDMDEMHAVAERHGVALIEDAAHALGATYRGRPVGALGDFAAFSFQAIKLLTCGDGGMLVCANRPDYERAARRRWFGIDRDRRSADAAESAEDVGELGFKYNMNDISASIGIGQLELLPERLRRRRELNVRYRRELRNVPGLTLLKEDEDRESSCWLFTVLAEERDSLVDALRSRGVGAGVWHRRIDAYGVFGGQRDGLRNQQAFDEAQLSLPLRDSLSEEEVETILRAVRGGW